MKVHKLDSFKAYQFALLFAPLIFESRKLEP